MNRQLTVCPAAVVPTRPNGLQAAPATGTAVLVGRGGTGGIGPREREAVAVMLAGAVVDAAAFVGCGRAGTGAAVAGPATVMAAIADGDTASARTDGVGSPAALERTGGVDSFDSTCRSPTDTAGCGLDGCVTRTTTRTPTTTATIAAIPATRMPRDANDRAR